MKLVLLGKNGQVGWELQRSLAPLGEVIALDRARADLAQPDQLAAVVRELRPQVIVNAAAYTAVDKAESEPDLARLVNASAPGALANVAAALGAWLVHYSTDYVFDGSGNTPRAETAPTGPLNAYGRSKLEGEERIRAAGCKHLILRTSWVYGVRGDNFAKTMLRLAGERERLRVIDDQFGAPTSAEWLADITAHALKAVLSSVDLAGTYHATAHGETSWYGYASFVVEWARAHGRPIKTAGGAIDAVPANAFPTAAKRPHNSRLDNRKLHTVFGLHSPAWQSGVERLLDAPLTT